MKCYAIRDDMEGDLDLAWLFYDPVSERFFIELPDEADPWMMPPPLDSLLRRGLKSVSSKWAAMWVAQRIVPPDRQNLGMILKKNGLREYDPHKLLVLADGRCAQDDCYIVPADTEALPQGIRDRLQRKVYDVIPLYGYRAVVMFKDKTTRLTEIDPLIRDDIAFAQVLSDEDAFMRVDVTPLGNGIEWGETRGIPAEKLYVSGKKLPLTPEDFEQYTRYRTLDTSELSKKMHCSRQYIKQLSDEGRLHPIRSGTNHTLYPAREAF